MAGDRVVCESSVAITTHLRVVSDEFPLKLSGHWPRPHALCGAEVAWDTQLPLTAVRCRKCRAADEAERGAP